MYQHLEPLPTNRLAMRRACCAGANSKTLVLLFIMLNTECARGLALPSMRCHPEATTGTIFRGRKHMFKPGSQLTHLPKKNSRFVEWGVRKGVPTSIGERSKVHTAPRKLAKAKVEIRCKCGLMTTR